MLILWNGVKFGKETALHCTEMLRIKNKETTHSYIELLAEAFYVITECLIFKQDNIPICDDRITMNWFREKEMKVLE